MSEKIKSVALITTHSWVATSTSVLSTIKFFIERKINVTLFVDEWINDSNLNFPKISFPEDFFKLVIFKPYLHYERPYSWFKRLNFLNTDKYKFEDIEFAWVNKYNASNCDLIIGYDEKGLERAWLLNKFWRKKIIYHSLELFEKVGIEKKREIKHCKDCEFLITQDEKRREVFAALNEININKIKVVYNSTSGNIIETKSNYFRDLFGIKEEQKIILFVGSVIPEHGIFEVIEQFKKIDKSWVLVIHGWIPDIEIKKKILNIVADTENIFYSGGLLADDKKFDIFTGVDVGLVFFKPLNSNLKYAAGSAGKLFDFIRSGVPVIGNNIPGMNLLLEGNNAGVTLDDDYNLELGVKTIEENFDMFRKNSFDTFVKYEFSKTFETVIKQFI